MGLGKTIQALAVLVDRAPDGPALVVAPTSVGSNWIHEARRFAPTLRPVLYREPDREVDAKTFAQGDLVVVTYGLALRDVEALSKVRWGTLVLDEAQFVKNSQTKPAQAVRRMEARWRLALTGTPVENHLGDLWSLFRAVCPWALRELGLAGPACWAVPRAVRAADRARQGRLAEARTRAVRAAGPREADEVGGARGADRDPP